MSSRGIEPRSPAGETGIPTTTLQRKHIFEEQFTKSKSLWLSMYIKRSHKNDFFIKLSQIHGIRNRSLHMWIFRASRHGFLFKCPYNLITIKNVNKLWSFQRWCCNLGISRSGVRGVLTFFQIGCGHTVRGSPFSTFFGTWKKYYYAKLVLVGTKL